MKQLAEIIQSLPTEQQSGPNDRPIKQLQFDSRKVEQGDVFVAIKGVQTDGHHYIEKAIESGAVCIVCEDLPTTLDAAVTYLQVHNSAVALGRMAARFYGDPSRQLQLIGITGTNGKTTTATLLHQLFEALGYKTGLISTIENKIGQKVVPAHFTTPDSIQLNELLAHMVKAGCEYAFMEVSSHAVDQQRIAGLHYRGGVFTNLSHDHLDYHKTFKEYIRAKKRFFDLLPPTGFALINADDKNGSVMVQNTKAGIHQYSLRTLTDFKARILDNNLLGLQLELNGKKVFSKLIGEFNAYNLLAVFAVARLLEQDEWEVLTALSNLTSAEGRFDHLIDRKRGIIGIVDYAHTPDALEKVLVTIGKLSHRHQKLITVVGCGGDRDRAKRPLMARLACRLSDQLIITSDNPRSEEPETIIAEMEQGIAEADRTKVLSISNRKEAIRAACRLAKDGDIVLIAGKGHEKYQEIKGVKHPFDDKKILAEALKAL